MLTRQNDRRVKQKMELNFKIAINKAQRTDDSHYHKVGTGKTYNQVLYYSTAEHKVVEQTDKYN